MQNLSTVESFVTISTVASFPDVTAGEPSIIFQPAPVVTFPAPISDPSDGLPSILVADDDADDRFFIQRFITKTGAKNPVREFDDGTELVNYLGGLIAAGTESHQRAPRLLFLDLNMAGLGGFGFLEWVRQQKRALPLTMVVLSNSAEPSDVARALELGAHRYLVKYPSVQTFTTIVRSVYPFKAVA